MPSVKQKLLIAAASASCAVLLVEAALRFGMPVENPLRPRRFSIEMPDKSALEMPGFPFLRGELTSDPRLKTELLQNAKFELLYDAGQHTEHPYMRSVDGWFALDVQLNQNGRRGAVHQKSKPMGKPRIACVGDSFTFGDGVNAADCWTSLFIDPDDAEVINFGVPGYDSSDVLASVETKALDYAPDLVIWGVVLNDPPSANDVRLREIGKLSVAALEATRAPAQGLASFSRIAALLQKRAAQSQLTPQYYKYLRAHFEPGSASWAQFQTDLAALKKLLEPSGTPLLVITFPMLNGLEDDYPFAQQHAQIAAACEQLGVSNFDLAPAFAGKQSTGLWVHPGDQHPNPRGHAIAAKAIAAYLAEHHDQLLP